MDQAVDRLRRNVEVRLEGELAVGPPSTLFVVEVRGPDRGKVAKVAALLPQAYAEMTRDVLRAHAQSLREVLDAQAADLSRQLAEGEQRILRFKLEHLDELPDAVDVNSRAAARTESLIEMRLATLMDARRRRDAALASIPEAPSEPGMAESALDLATRKLEAARAWYGDGHPDVRRARREVEEARARRDAQRAAYGDDRLSPQLARIDAEVGEDEAVVKQLRADLERYQKRMEAAPRWAQELAALSRDYDTLRAKYVGTVSRRADAATSEALLAADAGTLFHVLQPAVANERPVAPDRGKLLWIALAAALAAGLGAAGAAEWADRSLRGPEDASAFGVPVLAAVPRIGPGGRRASYPGAPS
jgi:uncharacterized protein involved in exopolysaccharide biosynthesis